MLGSTSGHSSSSEQGLDRPVPSIGSNISIRDFLQNVNDNLGKPYINSDGTPNYGIYFGDNKTGGVMYIGDHPRSCGKDQGALFALLRLPTFKIYLISLLNI